MNNNANDTAGMSINNSQQHLVLEDFDANMISMGAPSGGMR